MRLPAEETLPATSVCLTSTVLDPCTSWASVGALVLQLLPPSMRVLDRGPALDAGERERSIIGDLVAARGAGVVGKRHARRRRDDGVEREGEGGGGRDVAGKIGLPHLDGVGPLRQLGQRRGAGAPVAAAVERVLDRGPGLHARQRQRRIVGDLVAARGAGVVGKRHAGRRRHGLVDHQRLGGLGGLIVGLVGNIGLHHVDAIGQRLRLDRGDVDRPGIAGDRGVKAVDDSIGAVDELDRRGLAVFDAGGDAADSKTGAASAALMVLSPAIAAMAIETAVSSTVRVWVASGA